MYRASSLSISGNIPNGVRAVIYVDGNVRITNQIKYANSSWSSVADVPSLHIYVKGNITIDPGVEDMTGFYVAQPSAIPNTGRIITCAQPNGTEFATSDLLSMCANKLTVRGGFVAQKVRFLRVKDSLRDATAVSEASSSSSRSAEVFQFGPELYMVGPEIETGTNNNNSSGYDYFTSLPPIL